MAMEKFKNRKAEEPMDFQDGIQGDRRKVARAMSAGLFVMLASVLAFPSAGSAQECPEFTYSVDARTVDPDWPAAYYNKFPMLPDKVAAELSANCVQTPPGFSAKLWASEDSAHGGAPSVIAITFDEKGRVWAVEAIDYPHNNSVEPFAGSDRIVILEDTDGDGLADSRKVFAEDLNLATGLVHTPEGLVVSMSTQLVLFTDEDGDDVADEPTGEILYSGFARNDTHGMHSNLTYGLDNWVYGKLGYNTSTISGSGGAGTLATNVRGGIWRAKTDGSAFEFLTPVSAENTWGLGMTEMGQLFYSRANRDHSRHLVYPSNNTNAIVRIPDYPAPDQVFSEPQPVTEHWHINNAGYSSTSNHSIYTARHFPEKYWDRAAFICESPRHLCHTMLLDTAGSTWVGSENDEVGGYNLFASTDAWTAPIQAVTGPDGAVWVVDWYNYLLSHNWYSPQAGNAQVSPIRDNEHGRIYRVVYGSRPLDDVLNLSEATEDQLLETLKHPNLLWRLHAQRLLLRGGSNTELVSKLTEMMDLKTVNDMGESPHVIHAMRILEGFGSFASVPGFWTGMIEHLLLHPSPGVRWNAIDALPDHASAATAILNAGRINDPDAHVRVRALHKLSTVPGEKSGAMYTPYVTLDAHSQNRFNAVGGLTQSATMPEVPPLEEPVSIQAGQQSFHFPRNIAVLHRNGLIEVRGLDGDARGMLTIRDARGASAIRLPIVNGRAAGGTRTLRAGVYVYRIAISGESPRTGRVTVLR